MWNVIVVQLSVVLRVGVVMSVPWVLMAALRWRRTWAARLGLRRLS